MRVWKTGSGHGATKSGSRSSWPIRTRGLPWRDAAKRRTASPARQTDLAIDDLHNLGERGGS